MYGPGTAVVAAVDGLAAVSVQILVGAPLARLATHARAVRRLRGFADDKVAVADCCGSAVVGTVAAVAGCRSPGPVKLAKYDH